MNSYQDKSTGMWVITPEEKAKNDNQFYMMNPVAGYLTGEQVKSFFLQSGLPQPVLGKIWQLSDLTSDGKMDKREFSIAMHLIKKALLGFEIPHVLPPNFLTDVAAGSVFNPGIMNANVVGGLYGTGVPPMNVVSFNSATMPYPTLATANSYSTLNKSATPTLPSSSSSGEWIITPGQRLRYKQMFNNHDSQHKGYLTGLEAKSLLSQSGLTHTILAQIWCLADIDTDGNLSPDEFCVAMYLIDQAKSGFPVPATLPVDLVPPSYRRTRRMSENVHLPQVSSMPGLSSSAGMQAKKSEMFGELGKVSGSIASSCTSPDTTSNVSELEPAKIITFEDKRKENFDRGQAELERRRAQLRDFQMQESEERLAAERAEQEKKEKLRLEQELRKQQELEKQFERQRQIEMEKEEQRRKVLEQKEAARRELERQRQLEWERQRRDQLLIDKNKEESFVDALKQETSQMKLQSESMSEKKQEFLKKIEQTKISISDMSSTIDSMKLLSLSKSTEIDVISSELEEIEMKLVAVQQESIRLMKQRNTPDHANDESWQSLRREREERKNRMDELKKKLEIVESMCQSKENKTKQLQSELDAIQPAPDKKTDSQYKSAFHTEQFERGPSIFNNFEDPKGGDKLIGGAPSVTAAKVSANIWEDAFSTTALSSKSLFDDITNQTAAAAAAATATEADTWSHAFNNSVADKKDSTSSALWTSFADSSATQDASLSSTWTADFNTSFAPFTNTVSSSSTSGMAKKYKALYRFDARNADELSLMEDDVVLVYNCDQVNAEPGWLIGRMNGKEGCFPEAYVSYVGDILDATAPSTSISFQKDSTTISDSSDKSLFDNAFTSAFNSLSAPNTDFLTSPISTTSATTKPLTTIKPSLFGAMSQKSDEKQQVVTDEKHLLKSNSPAKKLLTSSGVSLSQSSLVKGSGSSTTSDVSLSGGTSLHVGATSVAELPLRVQAVYQWLAKKDNHLSFSKGDIIVVLSQQDTWWFGEIAGKTGWFPKSYVKALGASETPFPLNPPEVVAESYETLNGVTLPQDPTTSLPLTPPSDLPERHKLEFEGAQDGLGSNTSSIAAAPVAHLEEFIVVAMFTYNSKESGDLSFVQGDVFPAQKTDDDWWTGTINGVTGIFPASYVQEMETMNASKLSDNKKPEVASVIAAYPATGPEQLTLQPGQLIHVRKKSPSGWWEGELQAKGQKRKVGWFPANYVKLLGAGSSQQISPVNASAVSSSSAVTFDSQEQKMDKIHHDETTLAREKVVAMYNYQGQADDDLSFEEGNVINLIEKTNSDWWKGELNGAVGIFPANYVAIISNSGKNALN